MAPQRAVSAMVLLILSVGHATSSAASDGSASQGVGGAGSPGLAEIGDARHQSRRLLVTPSSAATMHPVPAPTKRPIPLPTKVPIPAPTALPTMAPSLTLPVLTENELHASFLDSWPVIRFGTSIDLTRSVNITDGPPFTVDGGGFEVNGRDQTQCFRIRGTVVAFSRLTFSNCYVADASGGAVWAEKGSSLTLDSCTFHRCVAEAVTDFANGGGMAIADSHAHLTYVTFSDCGVRAVSYTSTYPRANGGALAAGAGARLTLVNSMITNCSAFFWDAGGKAEVTSFAPSGYGGGVFIFHDGPSSLAAANVTLSSCLILGCSSYFGGGGVFVRGAYLTVLDSTISNNVATLSGGSKPGSGGGFYITDSSVVEMKNSVVAHNVAKGQFAVTLVIPDYGGGGIFADVYYSGAVTKVGIKGCFFKDNLAMHRGGGIYNAGASIELSGTSFSNNSAAASLGGALQLEGGTTLAVGIHFASNWGVDLTGSKLSDVAGSSAASFTCGSNCLTGHFGLECKSSIGAEQCVYDCDCQKCPKGTFASGPGAISVDSCLSCGFGSASAEEGASVCGACAAGRFATDSPEDADGGLLVQVIEGASSCNACPAGYHSGTPGMVVCQLCPASTYALTGSSSCPLCRREYYLHPQSRECVKCPNEASCPDDGGSTLRTLGLKADYWRISANTTVIHRCPFDQACGGGFGTDEASQHQFNFQSDDYCAQGYTGPLCAVCDSGYFFIAAERTCKQCGEVDAEARAAVPMVLFGLVFLVAVGVYLVFRSEALKELMQFWEAKLHLDEAKEKLVQQLEDIKRGMDDIAPFSSIRGEEGSLAMSMERSYTLPSTVKSAMRATPVAKVRFKTTTVTETTIEVTAAPITELQAFLHSIEVLRVPLKSLASFIQISLNIPFSCSIKFPGQFQRFLGAFALFNFDLLPALGLECEYQDYDYITKMIAMTTMPIALAGVLLLVYLALDMQSGNSYVYSYHESQVAQRKRKSWFMYMFLLLTFLVLVTASTMLFGALKCDPFPEAAGGTKSFLVRDYSISCNGIRYRSTVAYVVAMILIYPVGIPSMYAVLLWQNREVLRDPEARENEAENDYPTIGHLVFLIESYKPEMYFMEVFECAWRLMLASVIGAVAVDSAAAPTIGLLVCLAMNLAFGRLEPYVDAANNLLGLTLSYSLSLEFLVALLLRVDTTTDDPGDEQAFAAFLILIFLSGPLLVVYQMVKLVLPFYPIAVRECAPIVAKFKEKCQPHAEKMFGATCAARFCTPSVDAGMVLVERRGQNNDETETEPEYAPSQGVYKPKKAKKRDSEPEADVEMAASTEHGAGPGPRRRSAAGRRRSSKGKRIDEPPSRSQSSSLDRQTAESLYESMRKNWKDGSDWSEDDVAKSYASSRRAKGRHAESGESEGNSDGYGYGASEQKSGRTNRRSVKKTTPPSPQVGRWEEGASEQGQDGENGGFETEPPARRRPSGRSGGGGRGSGGGSDGGGRGRGGDGGGSGGGRGEAAKVRRASRSPVRRREAPAQGGEEEYV